MQFIRRHIERAREKPHHEKQRIVYTWAGTGAGVIAFVWFVGSISSGAFSIKESSIANDSRFSDNQLAGVGAVQAETDSKPKIQIMDSAASTTNKQPERTTLPF